MSVQTNVGIKRMLDSGDIIMEPLSLAQINNGSVDVRLGNFIARLNQRTWSSSSLGATGHLSLNTAVAADVFKIIDLRKDDGALRMNPGERVLAHTHEFIGSRRRSIPEMRAKSTMARWGLTVCACAGWGDVGYFSRWAMEVTNLNPFPVEIAAGTLVAQIVFHAVDENEHGTEYHQKGSYQSSDDIDVVMASWRPEMLLPKAMAVSPLQDVCPADKEWAPTR